MPSPHRLGAFRGFAWWWPGALGLLVLWVLVGRAGAQPGPDEGARRFTRAQAHIVTDSGSEQTKTVDLPYFWDRDQAGRSGRIELTVSFELPQPLPHRYALFAPNLSNQYQVLVNGAVVDAFGEVGKSESRLPRWMPLDGFVRPGANELRIQLQAQSGYRGGLSPLLVASREQTLDAYETALHWRYWWRIGVVSFCTVVGGLGLLLWWLQRRRGLQGARADARLYLYSAVAEFSFAFMSLYTLIEAPAGGTRWSATAFAMAVSTWSLFVMHFGTEVAGWPHRGLALWWRRWLWVAWGVGLVVALLAWNLTHPAWMSAWYPVLSASSLGFFGVVAWQSLRRGADLPLRLLAMALAANVGAGVVEAYRQRYAPSLDGGGVMYYSALLFGVVSMVVIGLRFRAALVRSDAFARELGDALADREAELRRGYEHLAQLEREHTRSAERTRILRDMHDGVGMHLNVALRQLQSGHADATAVASVLQEGLDQLKLSIDALNIPPGDLTALLASVRYRLEPRLRAAKVALEWRVEELPLLAGLDDKAMRHLQYVVYEAFSNVLQHAGATRITLQAQTEHGRVRVRIADNGQGFDLEHTAQRGLKALRDRVEAVHGTLSLHSAPQGTVVEVVLG
ncbi:MAG: sensor histidine kinase [Rhodoferax sp.]